MSSTRSRTGRLLLTYLLLAPLIAGGLPLLTSACGKRQDDESSTSPLSAYRKQVSKLDGLLQAEQQKKKYRIGVFTTAPKSRYPSGALSASPDDASGPSGVYVGVALREKRTKRYLPGSTVKLSVGEQTHALHETWGDFHHYGTNIDGFPGDASSVTVSVSPPAYGRHAGMKGSYLKPVEVTFPLETAGQDGRPAFSGPAPKPVPDDVEPGAGIRIALDESGTLKTAGPYRIGFIVEGAEPFWTWENGELAAQPGESPDQNHFEIVLLDKKTNEPIPHAEISLSFEGGDTTKTIKLHPLLAEFYHYGTNASVPAGRKYTVTAEVKPPSLYTFEKDRFTSETVTFEWSSSK